MDVRAAGLTAAGSAVYVVLIAVIVLQFVRLRRALHVFQLEGYKRRRFLQWCMGNRSRALFLRPAVGKKPMVMTGRAARILATASALVLGAVLIPPLAAGLAIGESSDLIARAIALAVVLVATPLVIVLADVLLAPTQRSINARFLRAAAAGLREVHPVVIGVTGSFGKTSTKFAIAGLIADPKQVLATPSSFNTPLGVCRTINERLRPDHRFFVVEMGAYRRGDIAELARFVAPSIGVLTAIGPAHLDRFGSMDAIERAKYELIAALPSDGVAIMNSDDHAVRALADKTGHVKVVRYGMDPGGRPDVTARGVETTTTGTRLTVVVSSTAETLDVQTRLLGRYAIGHVLAAVAVAFETGTTLAELGPRIAALQPVEHRLQLIQGAGGVTVVDDAYNSNPEGASAALEVLAQMPASKRVVVTPGMVELGELQYDANVAFGRQAASVADTLIVVARVNRAAILEGARRAGSAEVIVVDSLTQATEKLAGVLSAGDAVLFENDLPDQYES